MKPSEDYIAKDSLKAYLHWHGLLTDIMKMPFEEIGHGPSFESMKKDIDFLTNGYQMSSGKPREKCGGNSRIPRKMLYYTLLERFKFSCAGERKRNEFIVPSPVWITRCESVTIQSAAKGLKHEQNGR